MLVLGIETTCDETAAAVVERTGDGLGKILSNIVLSQITEHAAFGGVVPEIAARAHVEALDRIVGKAMTEAGKTFRDGTPDEYKAVGQGMLVTFGKYSMSEADKTITTDIEGSSFPNLAGGQQKRVVVSVTSEQLHYRNPTGAGGDTVELIWKRAK